MPDRFAHPETKRFFQYWDSLPKSGFMPDRADFDPLAIHKIMPRILMVEYFSADRVEFRMVGTGITEDIGFDPTKQSYLDRLEDSAFGAFESASDAILTTPCGGYFVITAQSAKGYIVDFDVLDLPMTNRAAQSTIIVAHLAQVRVGRMVPAGEFRIKEIRSAGWIDIGAGVPAEPIAVT
ncbi:hypothetical protein FHS78_002081 [Parvibaculum indicum]|uniref:PAS domain-containing protein n=1 Tax=Parvibaculum indicum TaxID=562969 RepID=UPI001423F12C|nr:PAS domain-containing protein [Parvibaculum indicum]NIJ41791.1 hypothetical protein [Parvibaculum indicum]